jgi:[citrate (pro-3S)-lyase] ligase
MKELLPRYGIEFRVITRKEDKTGVISASRVRKCLADNNFDELRGIVPESTYRYLVNNYKK